MADWQSWLIYVQVGAVSGGVASAKWSPDGEVLVLVSGKGQLLLMNKVTIGDFSHSKTDKGSLNGC